MSILEKLTSKEEKAIEELQIRMEKSLTSAMRDDEKLLYYRFLKARDFDLEKAEKMLRKHLAWRKIWLIETILEDFKPSEMFLKYPYPGVIGFDKEGDLIRYCPGGKLCPLDIVKCFTHHNFMKHWFWFAEKTINLIKEENKKTGNKGYQCIMIFDLDKIAFSDLTSRVVIDMFLQFINAYQDNYPERMKCTFAINVPSYFVAVFSILKAVMSNAMLNKIHIYGSTGWQEKLLEKIDADVLPAFLGGNRTDPDGNPLCHTFVNHGGKIPRRYFLSEKERYFVDAPEINKLMVPPSEKKEIFVEVDDHDSLLKWEFLVKGRDIAFGVFHKKSDLQITEIIPMYKWTTTDGTVKDFYKCESTGKYIIVFDNSYSWMNQKEVHYCITVEKPKV